jgi:hypothetical protein
MNSSLNQKKTDMFPFELTEAESSELTQWLRDQMRIKEYRRYHENIKRQIINKFRTKKNKLEMKKREAGYLERMKLVNQWINDQKKKGHVFKSKNKRIKLKEANPMGDHMRLYKEWISEQQRRGKVFRKKPRIPLAMELWDPPNTIVRSPFPIGSHHIFSNGVWRT